MRMLDAIAYKAVRAYKNAKPDADLSACLAIPHLIRAHGLAAALNYAFDAGESGNPAAYFLDALHEACPIAWDKNRTRLGSLKSEDHTQYAVHSRVALRLSDHWTMAARTLLDTNAAPIDSTRT